MPEREKIKEIAGKELNRLGLEDTTVNRILCYAKMYKAWLKASDYNAKKIRFLIAITHEIYALRMQMYFE